MNSFDIGVIIFLGISTIVMGIYYFASKRPLRNALIGASSGVGTLIIAKMCSSLIGITVSVNIFTILTSVILGIPGAACTIILNVIFGIS